ncbi:MAG: hypothetical protein ACKVP0_25415 [Pirellulaceae bacterium]
MIRFVMIIGILALICDTIVQGGEDAVSESPERDTFPKSVELKAGFGKGKAPKSQKLGFLDLICQEVRMSESNPSDLYTFLIIDYNVKPELKELGHSGDGTTSLTLSGNGRVFPLGTSIYRVAEIKFFGKPLSSPLSAREGVLRLDRVDEDWAAKLAPKRDSFVIPSPGNGTLHCRGIVVKDIFQEKDVSSNLKYVVKIELLQGKELPKPVLVLKEGETFEFENAFSGEKWRHTVRRIVPEGIHSGVKGWVEFDLNGMKVKEDKEPDKTK